MITEQLQEVVVSPIYLTTANFWQELEDMVKKGEMKAALADCLKSLVSSQIHSMIGPEATPNDIRLAKQCLQNGIFLSDSVGDCMFDVMVFIPNSDRLGRRRSFFKMVPKYSEGELKYLKYL